MVEYFNELNHKLSAVEWGCVIRKLLGHISHSDDDDHDHDHGHLVSVKYSRNIVGVQRTSEGYLKEITPQAFTRVYSEVGPCYL